MIINIYAAYLSDDGAAAELLPAAAEPPAAEPPPVEVPPSACAYACSNSINPTAVDSIASTANAIPNVRSFECAVIAARIFCFILKRVIGNNLRRTRMLYIILTASMLASNKTL